MKTNTHKHHIIPRHMGGSDDPSNIIELTVEEHAEAHRVLFEKHGLWQDYIAWQGLLGRIPSEKVIIESIKTANKNNKYCVGRVYSDETIQKFKKTRKGKRWSSVLTKEIVDSIRIDFENNTQLNDVSLIGKISGNGRPFTYKNQFCIEYAQKYNVTPNAIRRIIDNKTWQEGIQDGRV
jgi:hypothetical protein